MAKSKLRLTGFARLFIALLFIVPIAFLGANFINGGDGLTQIKALFGLEESPNGASQNIPPAATIPPPMEKAGQANETVDGLRDDLNKMYDENEALKKKVMELEAKLEATRQE